MQGRRRKQLLDGIEEARRYWKLKEEAKHRTLWRTQFGRGYEPVARQTTTRHEIFEPLGLIPGGRDLSHI
jgi:hypothetical protein